jgi:hypothetical protein
MAAMTHAGEATSSVGAIRSRARRGARALLLCLALAGGTGCATRYTPFEVDLKLGEALAGARGHLEQQEEVEAEQLIRAVQRIDPEYDGLSDLVARLPSQERDLFRRSWIGANRARRIAAAKPLGTRVLMYPADRVLDLFDVFTAEGHLGAGGYAEAHVTQGARIAAGARVVSGLGAYFRRTLLGTRVQGNAALHALGVGPVRALGLTAGAGAMTTGGGDLSTAVRPTDPIYQSYVDYWSVGGSATAGFFGGSAEIHLVQLADWVTGFALLDLGNDDLASTAPLSLGISERALLQQLSEIEQSQKVLADYRRRRPEMRVPRPSEKRAE